MTVEEALKITETIDLSKLEITGNAKYIANWGRAIETLREKQIPKEPSQILKHTDYFHWECPSCHMSYGMATQKVKYCYTCGQAIKWE